jgi:hypothetical protein
MKPDPNQVRELAWWVRDNVPAGRLRGTVTPKQRQKIEALCAAAEQLAGEVRA